VLCLAARHVYCCEAHPSCQSLGVSARGICNCLHCVACFEMLTTREGPGLYKCTMGDPLHNCSKPRQLMSMHLHGRITSLSPMHAMHCLNTTPASDNMLHPRHALICCQAEGRCHGFIHSRAPALGAKGTVLPSQGVAAHLHGTRGTQAPAELKGAMNAVSSVTT
jgi:hypothetical protein